MIEVQLKKTIYAVQGPLVLDVSLEIQSGELVALYGPSGSGKTTLLRLLAGLEKPESGRVMFGGEVWYDNRIFLKAQHRSVGFVFQDYALFPNMSIREQLIFALPDPKKQDLVDELLQLTRLETLAHRFPDQLSGGQKQRVALARAVARQPQLLLLDEPLSALDQETRLRLQEEIKKIHQHFGLTTLLVSHDVAEVKRLAHRVVCLDEGKITKQGLPAEVLSSGNKPLLGRVIAIQPVDKQWMVTVQLENMQQQILISDEDIQMGDRVWMSS
ncbi:sulfate/molybdate ABC transporter ATP-binding protein [Siphonobacter sp. SORGH_AS_1065]|uniref:sulfate/molybdate ABC transporter ATP-binding protein n=1 Tax=Siphonobacter sp. SORGH_AS_1065 TaxID=3041795 RepID=UPI00278927D8|nr:ATP-binding cassette domain-containing protein [Siphonobacter sp. SORGH_AS_1065]MDQ1089869.1 molybdate transport system ATP-binding protein [Siphonobacter sp. SORGH_AS_1065]